ncbi:alanine racemase [Polaromonas jejuensis]|uniref:Broad specificity amino-acid racemase n=1 Tax=Polaromonas jejuensis TaxID=457502 RepID=A0ABW0QEG7_9BURK|nr:alanine racemase [Polaromonas jejuensis]
MPTPSFTPHSRRTLLTAAIGAALTSTVAHAAPMLGTQGRRALSPNAWIEVDLSVFEQNLRHVQGALTGNAQLCAIMKADAYGVGIEVLMPSIIKARVPCVGIASTEEARVVRASGFKGRLMRVRSATPAEVEAALPYAVEELVGNLELAQSIGEIARKHRRRVRVHLGLNSAGMSRNGLELGTDKGREDAQTLVKTQGLHIVGVMTHFAVEERPDVLNGLEAFKRETAWLFANTRLQRSDVILHVANSFATLNVPEAHLDMVRTGAALYGYVGPRPAFQHVVSFKSRVASVNAYPAGNTVGYDRTFTLNRNSLLANLPVGYSDGYRRAYTNKGSVLVRGQRALVVGKVSMNTTMVDVTDIPGVKPGDEIVLFGKQGDGEITQTEIEQLTGVLLADQYAVWGNSNPKVVRR